jgi:hypothetical protein
MLINVSIVSEDRHLSKRPVHRRERRERRGWESAEIATITNTVIPYEFDLLPHGKSAS